MSTRKAIFSFVLTVNKYRNSNKNVYAREFYISTWPTFVGRKLTKLELKFILKKDVKLRFKNGDNKQIIYDVIKK